MKFTKTFKKIAVALMIMGMGVGTTYVAIPQVSHQTQVVSAAKRHIKYHRVTVNLVDQENLGPEHYKWVLQNTRYAIKQWDKYSRANLVFKPNAKHANITIYTYRFPNGDKLGATDARKLDHVDIFIDPFSTEDADDWLYNSIEHELGHAMGLGHSRKHYSIMYPDDTYDNVSYITDKDVAHVNRSYAHVWGKY